MRDALGERLIPGQHEHAHVAGIGRLDDVRREAVAVGLGHVRRRVLEHRWPEKETVADQSQGVPLATMQELARYWATDYDWRRAEANLNTFPQFVTTIDGLDIHFIHVRSREKNALPLIITHGWPGSVLEQIKLIGPLTDPPATAARRKDASMSSFRRCPLRIFRQAGLSAGPERMHGPDGAGAARLHLSPR